MISWDSINWLAWGGLLIGLAARMFLPFLAARWKDNSLSWEWRYIWPQLLGFAILVLIIPAVISDLNAINLLQFQAAWLAGWGAADVGRELIKALTSNEEDQE